MKKILLTLFAAGSFSLAVAQEKTAITDQDYANQKVEMADNFRGEGKIYVVVAVALTVLGGFAGYAWKTDQKLKKLETEIGQQA
ncbi:CcmD family protein [Persicobacter diffluens]|uniref:CcmD family protein n=1 Tax=Persicobacter diffluens TaxID=981 RepID=A0AAN5AMM3_9BACT|nr:hypothetical protein PEDI_25600 [Persicobacter diffluens]